MDKELDKAAEDYMKKEWGAILDHAEFTFTGKALKDSSIQDFKAGASYQSSRMFSLEQLKKIYEAGQDDCGEFGSVRGFEEMALERLNIDINKIKDAQSDVAGSIASPTTEEGVRSKEEILDKYFMIRSRYQDEKYLYIDAMEEYASQFRSSGTKELIEWLNQECPSGTMTADLSHDFAEGLRERLNQLSGITTPSK